jgi:hypothetical protein
MLSSVHTPGTQPTEAAKGLVKAAPDPSALTEDDPRGSGKCSPNGVPFCDVLERVATISGYLASCRGDSRVTGEGKALAQAA